VSSSQETANIRSFEEGTDVKLVLKGSLAFEDAKLAADACDPARRDQKRHAAACSRIHAGNGAADLSSLYAPAAGALDSGLAPIKAPV